MENTFSNTMDGNKSSSAGQAVYKCGLCGKEYFYYRDLALHERAHLNQMGLAGSVPASTLPPYHDSRVGGYNSATLPPPTRLDSFEKLAQPFHGEAQLRSNSEPKSISQTSPAPHPPADQDKVPMTYRNEAENRNILDTRSPDNRSIAMETRPLPVDPRPMSFGSRNLQSPDVRSSPHTEAHSLTYSSSQYMGNTVHPMYSDLNNKHTPTSSLGSYTATPVSHSADYFPTDVRNQFLPKLGPQIYGKSESYYPTDKTHYSHIPEKPHEVYATSQYGVSKLLAQTHDPYYASSPHPSPALTKYDVNKMTGPVTSYYSHAQPPHSTDAILKHDVRAVGQKSSMYYGAHETTSMSTPTSNMPYHMSAPKMHETSNTFVREPVNKLPERPIANRPFPGGHPSPHLPYSDLYKGSHFQPQVFPSMPSQISPSHTDYNSYKPAVEPVPSVNLQVEGNHRTVRQFPLEYTCHVCHLPCTNAHELSEHMKIHAMAQSVPIPHYVPQTSSASNSFTVPTLSLNHQTNPENNSAMSTSGISVYNNKDNLICSVCNKTFLKMAYLEEHKKSHISSDKYKHHCKTCNTFFSDSAKFVRHEQKHKRSDGFLYCEFCMETFKLKGNYLHHMTQKHGPPRSNSSVVEAAGKHVMNETSNPASRLILDLVNIMDCQICDLEVYRDQLVEHLSTHPLFMCRICDGMFVQNSELVEHLMKQHSKELEGSNRNRTEINLGPSSSMADKPSPVQRAKLEEEDSGLEEDKDDEGRLGPINRTLNRESEMVHKTVEGKGKKRDETASRSESPRNVSQIGIKGQDTGGSENSNKSIEKNSIPANAEKKMKKAEMKNLKENIQKKNESDETSAVKKQVKSNSSSNLDDSTLDNSDLLDSEIRHKKLKFSCSKCDKSFAKHGDLVQHVEVHNKDPSRIYCEVCDLSYHVKEKGYYMYHMKFHKDIDLINSQHPAQLPCVVCNKEFKKQVLVSHIIHQHTQFSCDICQWSYSSESSLLVHMKRIHGKKYLKEMKRVVEHKPSPVVYRKLKDIKAEEQAEEHAEEVSKHEDHTSKARFYRCEVCRKTLTKKSFLEKHLLKHSLTAEEQQISCDLCEQTFSSKGIYFYHLLKDHTKSTLHESQGQSDIHIKSDERAISGSTLGEDTPAVSTATNIKQGVKQVLTTVLNPVTGDFEEVLVDEPDNESDNNVEKVGDLLNAKTDLKDKVNVKDVIYCKLCNKSLNKVDLLNHMNSHTFFHCDTCKFTYTKKKPYLHHLKLLHIEQFINEEVEKVMQTEAVKKGSTVTVDDNTTPTVAGKEKRRRSETTKLLSCPLCSGEYRQHLYVQHIKTHLPQSWKCQFCSRAFSKKTHLAIHEKSHERICHSSSLPYPLYCPVCNSSLKSRNHYIEHVCGHLKRSPYKCKSCSETFLYEKAGDCHTRVQHDINGRVVWKLDGEGVKFDVKTGRIFDVISDYMVEIREINDLLRQNDKPEIWISNTAASRKKDKIGDIHRSQSGESVDSENEEGSDEKPKTDNSDDEYIPDGKRALRKRQTQKDQSDSDDDEDDNDDDADEVSTRSRPKRRRTTSSIADSNTDDEKYTPRGTKTRHKTRGKSLDSKRTPAKRSSISISRRSSPRSAKKDTKRKQSVEKGKAVKRKSVDNLSTPRTLRAKVAKSSTSGSEDQLNDKSTRSPNTRNLSKHMKPYLRQQKGKLTGNLNRTPASGRLKTRTRNLRSDLAEPPRSSSTPIRHSRAVVKISPLQMDVSETRIVKLESKRTPDKQLTCQFCKKVMHKNQWNFVQHVKRCEKNIQDSKKENKKETKQKEQDSKMELDENKPFSCKVCSESFKKKRDLYIHAKIHISEIGDGGAALNSSLESLEPSTLSKDSSPSVFNSTVDSDTSAVNMSQGESKLESRSDNNFAAEISDIDLENGHSNSKRTDKADGIIGVNEQTSEISKDSDKVVNNEKIQSNLNLSVNDKVDNVTNVAVVPEKVSAESVSEQNYKVNKNGSKSEMIHEVNSVNNNSDVNNKEDNDTDDRAKVPRNVPAVPKMSSQAALSKWKSKVTATLSSQLELHATKVQQELANPEAAKVKDFLSKSGKPERKNYECRICGDMFDLEEKFREHMDVHLNQSPPYCSLCNMYFMAIYPIRRLLEHNKKKHPELVVQAVTSAKPN